MEEGGRAERRDLAESIILGLGGNLVVGGRSPAEVMDAALQALPATGVVVKARSRPWRSAAWPDPTEPPYVNRVAWVETALSPPALLQVLHGLEKAFGRIRHAPNAPRPLDLDLIAYGRLVRAETPVLPHPRAAERRFVMGPLADIAPAWRHPLLGATAAELAGRAEVGQDAEPIG